MTRRSAGLLVYRQSDGGLEVLLAHLGGPFFARRDVGAWTLPKGEYEPDETPSSAARREFREELGLDPPHGELVELGEVRQSGGKRVTAFAVAGDPDPDAIVPGTFLLEWPRGSGHERAFPEVDRVAWFDPDTARAKLVTAQRAFVDRLEAHLAGR
ncbi:NUDIX domain-containing protein [Egicoccus halophilus]|uniref:DNA mismatch repair protein MutT n=1 Tax=Egicoccus halophilus TaxID=1670830 RepID=A0A8J3AAB3_9ACTN|nr:NUDIX domain-containing protein [Egicoccus halophilus]GGI08578.1 DNA mismatch repair protein MutT [Egicoccus halophilus]